MNILFLVLIFLLGMVVMRIIWVVSERHSQVGVLNIDRSDEDGPYVFLELKVPIDELSKKKKVLLDISNRDYLPRK